MANTTPIFAMTPYCKSVKIPYNNALIATDGYSTGVTINRMYLLYTTGADGTFVEKIVFTPTGTAFSYATATCLNIFLSTVADPAAAGTTQANTRCIGQVSADAVRVADLVNAPNRYEFIINAWFPTGWYIHVAQMTAQVTSTVTWQASIYAGNY